MERQIITGNGNLVYFDVLMRLKDADGMAKTVDPDKTAL